MKRLLSVLVSRGFIICLVIFIQLLFFIIMIEFYGQQLSLANDVLQILGVIIVVLIINSHQNPAYKLAWFIVILSLPLVGGLLYILFGTAKMPKQLLRETLISYQEGNQLFVQDERTMEEFRVQEPHICSTFDYLWRNGSFPSYDCSKADFFSSGETMYQAMLKDLAKAEKFIFLEYFIIGKGKLWNSILTILKEKVQQGVEIRILYDDFGSINSLPPNYDHELRRYGFKARVFNPVRPILAVRMNNRDHRKIMIIDGKIAYTGGLNLADEYINLVSYFGHWKDGGVRIKGKAVFSFTVIFLQMFDAGLGQLTPLDKYRAKRSGNYQDGIICPFADSPTDEEVVSELVYINIINTALKEVNISTPYLILDQEMTVALTLAAKRGVKVRIFVPHHPDKWYAHLVSKANYYRLVIDGVEIYEYSPGFIHAKTIIADDKVACVGTINMDYRSYYLHFECGVLIYKSACLKDIREDFRLLAGQSQLITKQDIENQNVLMRIFQAVLNILAPML